MNFTGSGQAIIDASGTTTFRNVTFSGSGTTTLSSPIHANGAFTISSGTLATGDVEVTFAGNFANSGTFTAGGSLITITGATAQSIAGFTTTGNVLMSKTGNVATLGGNVNASGLTINGSGGTLNLGLLHTHTFTGTWTRTNGTVDGNTSTLIIGGDASGSGGTFTRSTSTVKYNASGTQIVAGVIYNNLTLSGSGAKTSSGVTVNGILSMEGTATATNLPTYGAAATLQYNGSGAQTTGPEFPATWTGTGGIIIANSLYEVTLDEAKVINGPLNISNASATLNTDATNNYGLTLGGSFLNAGTLLANASNITISGTGTQNIDGFSTTGGNVLVSKTSGLATLTGALSGNNLTINNGSPAVVNLGTGLSHSFSKLVLSGNAQNLGSFGGTGSSADYILTAYFAPATGILHISASDCISGTWFGGKSTDWNTGANWCGGVIPDASTSVTIPSGGNQPVIGAAGALCNNITINSGATLTIGGNTLTVSGNWTNSGGTLAPNTGTVIFNGTADQTITGTNAFNNLSVPRKARSEKSTS